MSFCQGNLVGLWPALRLYVKAKRNTNSYSTILRPESMVRQEQGRDTWAAYTGRCSSRGPLTYDEFTKMRQQRVSASTAPPQPQGSGSLAARLFGVEKPSGAEPEDSEGASASAATAATPAATTATPAPPKAKQHSQGEGLAASQVVRTEGSVLFGKFEPRVVSTRFKRHF
jgi:hypothetical protein